MVAIIATLLDKSNCWNCRYMNDGFFFKLSMTWNVVRITQPCLNFNFALPMIMPQINIADVLKTMDVFAYTIPTGMIRYSVLT